MAKDSDTKFALDQVLKYYGVMEQYSSWMENFYSALFGMVVRRFVGGSRVAPTIYLLNTVGQSGIQGQPAQGGNQML
jgi:hypothetical protein